MTCRCFGSFTVLKLSGRSTTSRWPWPQQPHQLLLSSSTCFKTTDMTSWILVVVTSSTFSRDVISLVVINHYHLLLFFSQTPTSHYSVVSVLHWLINIGDWTDWLLIIGNDWFPPVIVVESSTLSVTHLIPPWIIIASKQCLTTCQQNVRCGLLLTQPKWYRTPGWHCLHDTVYGTEPSWQRLW